MVFYQTRQAQQAFLDNAASHARLLADAVGLHARGAVLGRTLTDAMLVGFLGSSARFVDYLDQVEPFRDPELAAFAAEAGLAAIRIVRPEGSSQGPPDWNPGEPLDCDPLNRLLPLDKIHTLVFTAPRQNQQGCILVAMDSRAIEYRLPIGFVLFRSQKPPTSSYPRKRVSSFSAAAWIPAFAGMTS